ncbi:hypothetical protein TRFO_33772 [Tritrichomonas foetus]|uniref:Uncharacterized protein n=1 Tax=Tritrichomonas foetus TaxID=1144522 RepID=A0A1J4JQD7_9EUKA|nr:hypothetical protein TRFO_33772 [Tritrichomonas foetus]|eukprot:OHS99741.1 hypothetical protein TRFO_33772 [Tritrichomonas foetus]
MIGLLTCNCHNIAITGQEPNKSTSKKDHHTHRKSSDAPYHKFNKKDGPKCGYLQINEQNLYVNEPENTCISAKSATHFCLTCNKCQESFLVSVISHRKAVVKKSVNSISPQNLNSKPLPTLDNRMPIEIRPFVQIGEPDLSYLRNEKFDEDETESFDFFIAGYESLPINLNEIPSFSCSTSYLMAYSLE